MLMATRYKSFNCKFKRINTEHREEKNKNTAENNRRKENATIIKSKKLNPKTFFEGSTK